jgi:hypothetical protein
VSAAWDMLRFLTVSSETRRVCGQCSGMVGGQVCCRVLLLLLLLLLSSQIADGLCEFWG